MSRRTAALAFALVALIVLGIVLSIRRGHGDDRPAHVAQRTERQHRPRPVPGDGALDRDPTGPADAALLVGRVEDASRARIAGARVVLRSVHPDEPEVVTTSAADGTFRFDVPDDGVYFALAEHPRHSPGGIAGPFSVREGRVPEEPVVVVLGSAAGLVARVIDPAGSPLAGVHVVLDFELARAAETDARGEVVWTALRPAGRVTVRATAPGFAEAAAGARLVAGEMAEVVVAMEAGRELHGRVVDPSRRTVPGATVRMLANPHRMGGATATTTTDERGEFVLVDLPDAAVVLVASHDDFAASEGVIAAPGDRFIEIPLRAPASLSGFVATRRGGRVEGAQIVLLEDGEDQPGTRSDEHGEFAYTKLPPGHYVVVARAQDGDAGRAEVTLAAGQEARDVEVLLHGPYTVRGTVVTRASGVPVPGARVWPRTARVGQAGRLPSTIADEDGQFVLEGLTLDVTRLDVRAPGYVPDFFPIEPTGEDLDVGNLSIEPRVFGGVGLGLRVSDGAVHVMGVYDGTPAARAGLQPGDTILEVDGDRIDGLELEDVVGKIRGSEGSSVRLRVTREGEPEPFVVDLTRETIEPEKLERDRHDNREQ